MPHSNSEGRSVGVCLSAEGVQTAGPTSVSQDPGIGYVFGKLHPLSEYEFVGEHNNDTAQTGFVSWFMLLAPCLPCTSHSGVASCFRDGMCAALHLANSSSQQSVPSV